MLTLRCIFLNKTTWTGFMCQRPLSSVAGEEVNSHCGGDRVIFFMDYVMYILLAVGKELGGGFVGVLTVYCFLGVQNMLCVVGQQGG